MDDEGNFLRKADIFEKRTIRQRTAVHHVDTASEALAVSLAEKAAIDLAYMVELTGKSEEEITSDLSGVIFLDPPSGQWQTAGDYLSGNVREKLAAAKLAAENNPRYASNIQVLEKVQPADLTASEIAVRLGATWLPADIVASFLYDLFETPGYLRFQVRVHFSKYTGEWNIEGKSRDKTNICACNTYGTARVNGYKILEDTLNLRTVRVFDYRYDDSGRKVPELDKKETAVAQGKQELIKQALQDWVWKDPARRERLCKLYNERFNSTRPRTYDGSHLTFSGMNPEITLRPHQTGAIVHILYGGNTLLAHVVGAGKSATRS